MPIYEYVDSEGEHHEKVCPVAERDLVPPNWRRITVPRRLNVFFPKGQPSQGVEILNGLKKYEQQLGTTALERSCGWSAKELKRIWSEPD